MPTYISRASWTTTGTGQLKSSPARLDAARQGLNAMGVKVISFYLTMGGQDMVIIAEAPSDEIISAALLSVLSTGTVTTNTSRAFTEEEYRKIFAALP